MMLLLMRSDCGLGGNGRACWNSVFHGYLVDARMHFAIQTELMFYKQEAFEKWWAHSRLRAASRPFSRCCYRYCRAPPAHRCPRRQRQWRQQRQRQRVTEGTAMAPWNGPNYNTDTEWYDWCSSLLLGRSLSIVIEHSLQPSVGPCVCVCPVHCGKMDDRIWMQFWMVGWMGPGCGR